MFFSCDFIDLNKLNSLRFVKRINSWSVLINTDLDFLIFAFLLNDFKLSLTSLTMEKENKSPENPSIKKLWM